MTIVVNGGSPATFNLTPGSPNCVTPQGGTPTCTASVNAPIGSDTFVVTLYAGVGGSGSVLGTKTVMQSVLANATNTIALVMNGVVSSISLALGTTTLPAGAPASLPLVVNAYDAQSNIIVGSGIYSDANGNPLTIVLSAQRSAPTVQSPYSAGAVTLSGTTLTSPTAPLTVSYDGNALLSAQFTATVTGGASIQPATATLTFVPTVYEYPALANGGPYSLTVGPDKQIWVTLFGSTAVEHFAPPAPGRDVAQCNVVRDARYVRSACTRHCAGLRWQHVDRIVAQRDIRVLAARELLGHQRSPQSRRLSDRRW